MDKKINDQLNLPEISEDLKKRIYENIELDNKTDTTVGLNVFRFAVVASLMFVFVYFMPIPTETPAIVISAINDSRMNDDAHQRNLVDLNNVFDQYSVKQLEGNAVLMSKFCKISDQPALHMKVKNTDVGELHLFVQQGVSDHENIQLTGKYEDKKWQIISSGGDRSIIVLQNKNSDNSQVEALVKEMFYG